MPRFETHATRDPGRMLAEIQRIPAGKLREGFLPLFQLADDSVAQVRKYWQTGDLYGLKDATGIPVGMVLVVVLSPGTVEMKSVAVAEGWQGIGVGQSLLAGVLRHLRSNRIRRVVVSTASASIGALAFYQKIGFRFRKIERDYFRPERGYIAESTEYGIRVRDRVWLDLEL